MNIMIFTAVILNSEYNTAKKYSSFKFQMKKKRQKIKVFYFSLSNLINKFVIGIKNSFERKKNIFKKL